MGIRWRGWFSRFVSSCMLLCTGLALAAQPVAALSLNPLDYYSYDYYIALSATEVEPGEQFSVTAGASVRCIRDLPVGVDEAEAEFEVLAQHETSGVQVVLLDRYAVSVDDVPDWAGDEYSTSETVDLAFPEDAAPGTYNIVARLEHLSLDGWNVTGMVPSSARTMNLGSLECYIPEDPPVPTPPSEPGQLIVSILGHTFRPAIDDDGYLLEKVNASLIEGLLSIELPEGTRCLDESGMALTHISASQNTTPRAFDGGTVLAAFSLHPGGATFAPSIRIGISYEEAELPAGCEEDDLSIAYYSAENGEWKKTSSRVDASRNLVSADVSHFSTVGLLAPTPSPGPARFQVRSLDVSPAKVAPFGRVTITVTITNSGDTADAYPLVVDVDGMTEHTDSIDIKPRHSRTVNLTVVRSTPGTYEVSVENFSKAFSVVTPGATVPPEVSPPDGTPDSPLDEPETPGTPDSGEGMNPVYIVLLAIAGIAFLTLVVLVLAGAL